MEKGMVRDICITKMVRSTLAIGLQTNAMVREYISSSMVIDLG